LFITTIFSVVLIILYTHTHTHIYIYIYMYMFYRIHMWLVWILSAGARHFIEIFPMSLLDDELNYNFEHQVG